ncbi:MAG: hypothetical protein U0586_05635 [Candidatus Brocadiaceae bacterium]
MGKTWVSVFFLFLVATLLNVYGVSESDGAQKVGNGVVTGQSTGTTGELINITSLAPENKSLLDEYAPILYMHPDERFYPIKTKILLENSDLYERGSDELIDKHPTLAKLIEKYNDDTYYLKLQANWDLNKEQDYWKHFKRVVYGHQTSEQDGSGNVKIALQYWFFYLYNDWDNSHDGDWEMIQIVLDDQNTPETITYSIHLGGLTLGWEEVEKVYGNHPKVFVTIGAHSSWHKEGKNVWLETFPPYGCIKCVDDTSSLGDVIFPKTLSQTPGDSMKYELIDVDDSVDEESPNRWIYWKGFWGKPVGGTNKPVHIGSGKIYSSFVVTSGPQSPPYIDYLNTTNIGESLNGRWYKPLEWAQHPNPSDYTICASANARVVVRTMSPGVLHLVPYCSFNVCNACPTSSVLFSENDLIFDVYSLDGKGVDVKISRQTSTGEACSVEFDGLNIPKRGKASFNFSLNQNPMFEIGIDNNLDGFYDSHRLPDHIEVK